jgi:dihydroceramidase
MANSFSNILTIALGLYGALRAKSQDLPLRYITCFTVIMPLDTMLAGGLPDIRIVLQGVAIVGLGSFIFHATLLYEAQLADELPMILVASHGFFVLLDTRPGFSLKNARGLVPLILFNVLFGWS